MQNEFSVDGIFKAWKSKIKDEDISAKYLASERKDYIEDLADMFKNAEVPYDEATFYREKAMISLTTVEGRKGKGKHKGWKEAVYDDFDCIMARYYIPPDLLYPKDVKLASLEDKEPWMTYQDIDGSVKKWLTEKYGFSEAKYKFACTIGHVLNMEYAQDVLGVKL
jgi:hypothetical protein